MSVALTRAELLGMERRDLADRRSRNRPGDISSFTIALPYWLLFSFVIDQAFSTVSRAIAGAALVGYVNAIPILRMWPQGESLMEALGTRRKLSRKRLETDELASQSMPFAMMPLLQLVLAAGFLSIAGADGGAPSLPVAWLLLGSVPLVTVATWIGVDRWFGPGMTLRILRYSRFIADSVSTAVILATASPVSALLEAHRPGIWFTLFLTQMAWSLVNLVAMIRIDSRRKKPAS